MKNLSLSRIVILLLALMFAVAGCTASKLGSTTDAVRAPEDATGDPAPDHTTVPREDVTLPEGVGSIQFFSVNLNMTGTDNRYLMAYPNEDGTVYVEYVGDVKKIGTALEGEVLDRIADAVVQSGIVALNGRNENMDAGPIGSAYVEYSDGTFLGLSFTGNIPQEYLDAYETLDACFQTITADLEVYVPVPAVMDDVDEKALAELLQILQNSGIKELDMFSISNVLKDDAFAYLMGLSSADGIAVGTSCDAMMITTPFSMVIATLEEGVDAESVRADFVANLNWQKWVCVIPDGALVAQKDNMVLCLMSPDSWYQQMIQAIDDCGWDNMEAIDRP